MDEGGSTAGQARAAAWVEPFDPARIPLRDAHRVACRAAPERLFDAVLRLGGEVGWHRTDALWRFRGAIDRLVGGVGMRRGRREPAKLRPGDPVDFWRVEAIDPGVRLLLRAEMKNPGTAWLEMIVSPAPGGSELLLTSYFRPSAFWGRLYYYSSYPAHWAVFQALANDVARSAERQAGGPGGRPGDGGRSGP